MFEKLFIVGECGYFAKIFMLRCFYLRIYCLITYDVLFRIWCLFVLAMVENIMIIKSTCSAKIVLEYFQRVGLKHTHCEHFEKMN